MEAALFDDADRCNDVCCGDKLITWTVEALVIIGRRSNIGALDFNIVALLNYVIVNQIILSLLWKRHYSMAPIVVIMSATAINYLQWRRKRIHRRRRQSGVVALDCVE